MYAILLSCKPTHSSKQKTRSDLSERAFVFVALLLSPEGGETEWGQGLIIHSSAHSARHSRHSGFFFFDIGKNTFSSENHSSN